MPNINTTWRVPAKNLTRLATAVLLACLGWTASAWGAIAYVQSGVSTQSSGSSVSMTYTSAQSAGDLNVVVVKWDDWDSGAPSSVTDSQGNTYTLAAGPTWLDTRAESIYYARNIVTAPAGANTVTVTFSHAVDDIDIRAAEYSGIDTGSPLDGAIGGTGTAATISSGTVTTTNANDLLVAGDDLQNTTISPGPGFTQREITPYSSILEDEIVSATGSYAGTAQQDATGPWIMLMAAFKGATSGGDTQPPSAPGGLTATAASSSQINLGWTASTDNVGVTGYKVERCQGSGCSSFSQIAIPTGTSFSDTGLSASTSYTYRVRAADAAGNSSRYSNTASATTAGGSASIAYVQSGVSTQSPGSSVSMTYTSAQSAGDLNVVVVKWDDWDSGAPSSVTDSQGNAYALAVGPTWLDTRAESIYYARNIVTAPAGANTVTVTFSHAVDGIDIRAAEYSGIDTGNPLDGAVGGTGTAATISSGTLTTTNANDLLVAGDDLQNTTISPGPGFTQRELTPYSSILEDEIVSATGSYAGTAQQDATGPWVMLMAAFKGATGGGDTQPPSAPSGLTATAASSSQINLSWTASTDNVGVTGYRVESCQGTSCTTFAQIGTPTATSYSATGLTAATSYSFRVRATDAAGNLSTYSSAASATTLTGGGDTTPPTTPTSLSAAATSDSQINVTWTASTDDVGVTGYLLERCQGSGCSSFSQIGTPTGTTYGDTGLMASVAYSYRVRATDAAGNLSSYSGTASATTQGTGDTEPPTAPSALTVIAASSTEIDLIWSASTDDVGVTGYLLERCQGASCTTFAQIASPVGPAFNDPGKSPSTSYSYRVRATDAANNLSGYSAVMTYTTPAESPDCD